MKNLRILSIPLLLVVLSFTVFQFSNAMKAPNHVGSSTLTIIDEKDPLSPGLDEEKKHSFHLIWVIFATLLFGATVLPFQLYRTVSNNQFIFMTPIFYESNYVVDSPLLES